MSESQFEHCYQAEKNYWGVEPSVVIQKWYERFQPGSVLDVGAGDGRNSVFLATKGFTVTALDTAPTGLANLKAKAAELGVADHVTTIPADIVDWQPPDQYDNIITHFTLHFVGAENIKPVIEKLIASTRPGGLNVIDDFTQNGPLARKNPEAYVTPELLNSIYQEHGWEILRSAVRPVQTNTYETPGQPYVHEAIAFVAKKPL